MKMFKWIPIVGLFILLSCFPSGAQVDKEVLKELKNDFDNIDTYEFIFVERELIEYCKDTIGRDLFFKRMLYHKKHIEKRTDTSVKTELLMLDVLRSRIKSVNVSDQASRVSKSFLEQQLEGLKPDFQINEKVVSELFDRNKRDKATMEVCDVGIAMYIVFIYNPSLYVKVLKESKMVNDEEKVFFPIKCTLQEYDRSIVLRSKMKKGLIELLGSSVRGDLVKIYNDIKKCNLEGSYE